MGIRKLLGIVVDNTPEDKVDQVEPYGMLEKEVAQLGKTASALNADLEAYREHLDGESVVPLAKAGQRG